MAFTHIPRSFGQLLAQNEDAANAFSMMTPDQKKDIVDRVGRTRTKLGKKRIIAGLAKEGRVE